ncbi:MAG: hypothetical protein LBT84_02330 [Spirochaetia bacterium]|jgi:hypothetical protein|nr:hypothetical protein [Spirochaetia bacterium]
MTLALTPGSEQGSVGSMFPATEIGKRLKPVRSEAYFYDKELSNIIDISSLAAYKNISNLIYDL